MNTQRPFTSTHRDDALRRLRLITLGAAATSLAAVAGFGGLAAVTNAGHASTTQAQLTAAASSTPSTGASAAADAGVSSTPSPTATAAPSSATSVGTSITAGPAGGGQVTTGGS